VNCGEAHGLVTGDVVTITKAGGMVELLGAKCKITVPAGETETFTLDGVDSTGFTPYGAVASTNVGRIQLEQYNKEASGLLDLPLNVLGDALASSPELGDNKFDNTNPKQEILTLGKGTFEIAEPMFLASWQHGYAVGHCPTVGASGTRDYTLVEQMPKDGVPPPTTAKKGAVYVSIESVEMHVAYVSPAQAFIPPSQSLRFSQYQVTTRKLHGNNIQESIVVPPGVRQVLVGLRQNKHGIQYDREELSKAGAGINEIPSADTGGTEPMYWWRDFQLQLGSAIAPTVAFSQMNPQEGSMARAYNEFLSVIGKPLGMRGNTLTYADYVGSHSCNGPSGPSKGDHGPVIALRLLTPDSSLSNNLQIRGTLNSASGSTSGPTDAGGQEMVVIVVADSLLDVQYAPPTEIPVSTAVNALV
jgi:hypothetical protein